MRLAVFFLGAVAVSRAAESELEPIGPGAWAVGSSNFEVETTPPAPMIDYLKGRATSKETRYVAEILRQPESALVTTVALPAEPARYGRFAGAKLPLVLYVLYPTTKENTRADYKFPYADTGDNIFPHMQGAGEKPIFAAHGGYAGAGTGAGTGAGAAANASGGGADGRGGKWPLIVYSGGWETHGLWDLEHLKTLASHGYIVVSVFHGDGRTSFETGLNARPLELRAAIDHLLAHPDFGPAIDAERIGVSGGSFGGYTVLTALGGKYLGKATPPRDPRIKAGFGLVPLMGASLGVWPFTMEVWPFGKDYAGLRAVRAPFFALYAEKDKNVPRETVEAGVAQIGGVASAVMLDGEQHVISKAVWSDLYTWEILFFDAWLKGDAAARQRLYGATSVRGGVHDHRTYLHAGAAVETAK